MIWGGGEIESRKKSDISFPFYHTFMQTWSMHADGLFVLLGTLLEHVYNWNFALLAVPVLGWGTRIKPLYAVCVPFPNTPWNWWKQIGRHVMWAKFIFSILLDRRSAVQPIKRHSAGFLHSYLLQHFLFFSEKNSNGRNDGKRWKDYCQMVKSITFIKLFPSWCRVEVGSPGVPLLISILLLLFTLKG